MTNSTDTAQFYRQGDYDSFFDMPVEINWPLTRMCNYHCSYCFGQDKVDKKKFSTFEQLENAVNNIAKLNRPSYDITLGGGEPTIHPHFIKLVELLSNKIGDKINQITIVTNGSSSLNVYTKIAEISLRVRINLSISIHTEHVNIDHFISIVTMLAKKVNIDLSLMFNPKKFEFVKKIFSMLVDLRKQMPFGLYVGLLREPPTFDKIDSRYTSDHFAWHEVATKDFATIVKNSHFQQKRQEMFTRNCFWERVRSNGTVEHPVRLRSPLLVNGFLNFKGMYCAMATSVIVINSQGICKGAQCYISNSNSKRIFEKNFSLDESFITALKCTEKNCGCSINQRIPKFYNKHEADNFIRLYKSKQQRLIDQYESIQNNLDRLLNVEEDYKNFCISDKTKNFIYNAQWKKSPSVVLGRMLVGSISSVKNFVTLPKEIFNLIWGYCFAKPSYELGGVGFSKVLDAYDNQGFIGVNNLLSATRSPKIRGDAYIALARYLRDKNLLKETVHAARLAFEEDPQHYRLKWLAFRLHDAGQIFEAEACLSLLPESTIFEGSDATQRIQLLNDVQKMRC